MSEGIGHVGFVWIQKMCGVLDSYTGLWDCLPSKVFSYINYINFLKGYLNILCLLITFMPWRKK